jgi:hypothetical protein
MEPGYNEEAGEVTLPGFFVSIALWFVQIKTYAAPMMHTTMMIQAAIMARFTAVLICDRSGCQPG